MDCFGDCPEAFAVPDKAADTVAHLLIEEIFQRFGCPLQIVTDNVSESVNKVVQRTMRSLNIHLTQLVCITLRAMQRWKGFIQYFMMLFQRNCLRISRHGICF